MSRSISLGDDILDSREHRKGKIMRKSERSERLMPNGEPRWVRCYDNGGETADRYSVLFTGRYSGPGFGLHMDARPTSPQGIGMSFEFRKYAAPDCVGNSWAGPSIGRRCALGTRIPFSALPEDCRKLVVSDYRELWGM